MDADRMESPLAILMGTAGKILVTLVWAGTALVLFMQDQGLLALVTFFIPPAVVGTVFVTGVPLLVVVGVVGVVAYTASMVIESMAQKRMDRALDRRWERVARAQHIDAVERELGLGPYPGQQDDI